jgi:DNA-directed RNA polymerase specialized sigma24 family protein
VAAGGETRLEPAVRPPGNGRRTGSAERWLAKAIDGAWHGDLDALHLLYVRYADEVCRRVERIVPDRSEAEDVTHDVFTQLAGAIDVNDQEEPQFVASLLRVARNAAVEHLERSRTVP